MSTQVQLTNLFDSMFDRIYKFFLIKTLDQTTAEDLTSETFVRLAEQLESEPDIDNAKSYLYGIARNTLNQYLREKYNTADVPVDETRIEAASDESELRTMNILEDTLRSCLEKLPDKQALILRLRFVERLSLKEMTKQLGKTKDYVKTTQRRALASMRKLVATGECIPKLTYQSE